MESKFYGAAANRFYSIYYKIYNEFIVYKRLLYKLKYKIVSYCRVKRELNPGW